MTIQERSEADGPDPLTLARAEMAEGERLIWADSPLPGSARWRVLPISLLGWLFLVLALAWMAKAAIASFWLLVMGLPFLLAAAAFALLPWWWPRMTRHTVYAISNRRILIIQNWPRRKISSYGPEDIDVVERRERKDGSGDIVFRREEYRKLRHHHEAANKRRVGERMIGFFGVADVRRLEDAIWALKERRSLPVDDGGPPPTSEISSTPPPWSASSEDGSPRA